LQALNLEDNTDGLRYEKVILAIGADVAGMHSAPTCNGGTIHSNRIPSDCSGQSSKVAGKCWAIC